MHARTLSIAALLMSMSACVSVTRSPREQPLRVMSYNIQYGNEGLDGVIAVIRSERPDIVGLQEVDVHWSERSRFVDQALALAAGTGMEYRFAHIYRVANAESSKPPREFGVALLSRYPIVSFINRGMTRLSTQEPNPVPAVLPGFLEAVVDVNGTRVRVLNVHLDFRRDPAVRRRQVEEILVAIGDAGVPTLLLGDMNARPDAPEIEPLFMRLRDTWPYADGPGLTSPARNPSAKIDYVLASTHFRVARSWIPPVKSSDHLPVVADLLLFDADF